MKETTKRVTLVDISKKTGYSVNCVSRALMDASDISASTKAKIKEVANELGYVQNLAAASLKNGNSKIIGILYDNLLNPFYNTIVYYIDQTLKRMDYSFITYQAEKLDEKIYKDIVSRNAEGILSFLTPDDSVIKHLKKFNFPFVVIGRHEDNMDGVTHVSLDNKKGGSLAAYALLERKCKNPAYFGEGKGLEISRERGEGFSKIFEEHNISPKIIFRGEDEDFSGITKNTLKENPKIDSIFCFSDLIAYEVLRELEKLNRQDIIVIGFDEIQKEMPMPIKIMTIGTDKSKFAKDAISLLFEQIQNKETKKGKKVVEDVYFVNKK